jgi:crotonobetainyl-CoA:carnitine CoA-transferase CaiB-like acyl-CoA transferase
MGQHMASAALSDAPVPPMPARVAPWAIYRPFASQEGDLIFIGVTTDKHWERFCAAFEREDLFADPRLRTNNQRVEARRWLIPELEGIFAAMPKAEILRRCELAQIPYTPINRPEDLFDDPHLNARGGLLDTLLPNGVRTKLPRLPLLFNGHGFGLYAQPPAAGQQTHEVLRQLGYDAAAIDNLARNGIMAW